jgi:hypothetical protein
MAPFMWVKTLKVLFHYNPNLTLLLKKRAEEVANRSLVVPQSMLFAMIINGFSASLFSSASYSLPGT